MVALTLLSISGIYFSIVFPGKFFLSKCSFCIFLVCFSFAGDDVTKSEEGHACSEPLPFWNKREIAICETGTSSMFPFSDQIIPLVLLRLISTPDNKQRIGPDWRFFRSGPIQQAISSKRTSRTIGSEMEKMELVPVSQITISRLFQNGSGSEQACPSSDLVTSSPERRNKQEKYKKSIWIRKSFQERQWKSKYHLSIEELIKLPWIFF